MNKLLAKLPAFVLPFVTRSLRGGRGKRYVLFSALIAGATLLMGLWLAFGDGEFEHGIRTEVDLELHETTREQQDFAIYVHDEWDRQQAERELRHLDAYGLFESSDHFGEVEMVKRHGLWLLEKAARSIDTPPEHEALQTRAAALLDVHASQATVPPVRDTWPTHFDWDNPEERATLERVLASGGVPEIHEYESPLGLRETVVIIGFLAGLALTLSTTVLGPLLVGVQQAQERHENTLMPLTGTGMTPRQLALGLASGPLAIVAIFAIPQLVLFGAAAILVGVPLFALSFLVALAASAVFVTFAAQLLGHLVGHRRTPGIIAIALLVLLGAAWLAGAVLATELDHALAGFAALVPTIGLSTLLVGSFAELSSYTIERLMLSTWVWTLAALVFGGLVLTALSRTIEGRDGPLLRGRGALLGALTCIGLIHVAIPLHGHDIDEMRLYLGLAGLALPLALLLMSRVPTGDQPARMRRVPVARLLGEFGGWALIHIVITATLFDLDPEALHPVAMLWMAWCVGTLGLIAIRLASVPATIAGNLWTGFCGATLLMGFMQSVFWGVESGHEFGDVFALTQVSPVLGLMQIAITVGIPLSLVGNLRKSLGSLSVASAEPSIPVKTS